MLNKKTKETEHLERMFTYKNKDRKQRHIKK